MKYYLDNYPMAGVESTETYPAEQRLAQDDIGFDEEKQIPLLSEKIAGEVWNSEIPEKENLFNLIKYLGKKLVEHSQALQVAEDQIKAILRGDPFIPEYFGFSEVLITGKHPSLKGYIHDSGALLYNLRQGGLWSYKPGTPTGKEIIFCIPNAMVGYHIMASLGIDSFYGPKQPQEQNGKKG